MNQEGIICLDEPDFHNPEQNHRGIPVLETLFPDEEFPARPEKKLSFPDAYRLIVQCQEIVRPFRLGTKTANWNFIKYARLYKRSGYPVIAIIRDIRDALVTPLPEWTSERKLNKAYRLIWKNLKFYDYWCRYEDLVMNPEDVMAEISRILRQKVELKRCWSPEHVYHGMIKLERHRLLEEGSIKTSRVGLWKNSGKTFHRISHRTAIMMGYHE